VVALTGKNTTASWYQVVYPSGPGGFGWVTVQYVQTEAAASLPVLDDYGQVVTPGAENGTPPAPEVTPTATVGPALDDGDSSTSPGAQVTFSSSGTHQFTYSSQVSAPQGDAEDWLRFTPYATTGSSARLLFSLSCAGNSSLTVELWQAGGPLTGWGFLACGETGKPVLLTAGQVYQVRLLPAPGDGLRLVAYTLTVQNTP
jgi:hypothetical protein